MEFPEWKPDTNYKFNDVVTYLQSLYLCKKDHTSKADTPPISDALLWHPHNFDYQLSIGSSKF